MFQPNTPRAGDVQGNSKGKLAHARFDRGHIAKCIALRPEGANVGFMRLWTLHPRYLDAKGLVASWREALLAQKVLSGATRGYRNHPQLVRFRAARDPMAAIATFLHGLATEAGRRGYHFDGRKIAKRRSRTQIRETRGQLDYEWDHLLRKLRQRSPAIARRWRGIEKPQVHPLFRITPGAVRDWEKR